MWPLGCCGSVPAARFHATRESRPAPQGASHPPLPAPPLPPTTNPFTSYRYQFLTLLYFLDTGKWPAPLLGGVGAPSPVIEREWGGWTEFYKGGRCRGVWRLGCDVVVWGQAPSPAIISEREWVVCPYCLLPVPSAFIVPPTTTSKPESPHTCPCILLPTPAHPRSPCVPPPCVQPPRRHHGAVWWAPAVPLLPRGLLGHPRGPLLQQRHHLRIILHVVSAPSCCRLVLCCTALRCALPCCAVLWYTVVWCAVLCI